MLRRRTEIVRDFGFLAIGLGGEKEDELMGEGSLEGGGCVGVDWEGHGGIRGFEPSGSDC